MYIFRGEKVNDQLAIFDIDKTIYDGYTIFDLAQDQFGKGVLSRKSLDKLFDDLKSYKSGNLEYELLVKSLNINWAEGLKGKEYSEIEKLALDFYNQNLNKIFPYFKPLLDYLKPNFDIYFITGESQFVGESMVKFLGVSGMVSTFFVWDEPYGKLTGEVGNQLDSRESKKKALDVLFEVYPKEGSIAFGDSEGDIEMLGQVDHAFCVNATEGLKSEANKSGWDFLDPNDTKSTISLLKNRFGD